jgi:hypothetical protein
VLLEPDRYVKPKDVPEPLHQKTPAPASSEPESFWQELKRRKVYSVGSAYLAAAWIAIEATSITFPSLGLPEWAQTLVVALAIAGFPVTLFAAWALEVTPEGVQVESDAGFEPLGAVVRRWRASATLRGAVVGGLIVLAAGTAASATRWRVRRHQRRSGRLWSYRSITCPARWNETSSPMP